MKMHHFITIYLSFRLLTSSPDGKGKLCEVKMNFFLAAKKRRRELFLQCRKKHFLQTNLQCTAGKASEKTTIRNLCLCR